METPTSTYTCAECHETATYLDESFRCSDCRERHRWLVALAKCAVILGRPVGPMLTEFTDPKRRLQ